MIIGKKYKYNGNSYVYHGDIDLYDMFGKAGLYLKKDGNYIIQPEKKIEKSSIIDNITKNFKKLPKSKICHLADEDDGSPSSSEKYINPKINDLDELLTRIIKQILIERKVNRTILKEKAKTIGLNERLVDNYISTLNNKKMSWCKFVNWLAMFEKDYKLDIFDKL